MILKEQKHANLQRSYYRGLDRRSSSFRQYDEIYLTTKFSYALAYAGANGIIEEYLLRDAADIFNMRCRTDEDRLRKFCQGKSSLKFYLRTFERLKSNDWADVFRYPYERQLLLDAVKRLGYDGYFNFEIDSEYYSSCRSLPGFRFAEADIGSPSVAVFSKDCLLKKAEYSGELLRALPVFKKARLAELKYIDRRTPRLIKAGEKDLVGYFERETRCLSKKELKDAVKTASTKENIAVQEELDRLLAARLGKRLNEERQILESSKFLKDKVFDY